MNKFSITYKKTSDPTKKEQSSLITSLQSQNIRVLDEIPGTIAIECEKSLVESVLKSYPLWTCSLIAKLKY
jgi:hypothetical protein